MLGESRTPICLALEKAVGTCETSPHLLWHWPLRQPSTATSCHARPGCCPVKEGWVPRKADLDQCGAAENMG